MFGPCIASAQAQQRSATCAKERQLSAEWRRSAQHFMRPLKAFFWVALMPPPEHLQHHEQQQQQQPPPSSSALATMGPHISALNDVDDGTGKNGAEDVKKARKEHVKMISSDQQGIIKEMLTREDAQAAEREAMEFIRRHEQPN
uniref:HYPK_UBA domain-containing protein n=1 Tax=Globodera pallida TaxID=36090 RepID=A0A183CG12_GLOPA